MNINIKKCIITKFLAVTAALPAVAAGPDGKPNIIFILADDLGIGNVSCYGADNFQTPNIDALAKSGIRFEHCYTSPLCGPSRALLLTGRYAYNTGMTGNDTGRLLNPANETMIPSILKPAGYVSGMCGKWGQLPLTAGSWGFDEYLQFQGSGTYWNTQKTGKAYNLNGREVPLQDGEYMPDRMHKFAVDFITRHKNQPFFLYYSLSHIHGPILRTPDSRPGSDEHQLYKDNVAYMDKLVGKLLDELDRQELREKTLIIFAGDNGTAPNFAPDCTVHGKALSGYKGTMLECGALVPSMISWPGTIPAGIVSASLIDFSDFLPTLAEAAGAKVPAKLTIDGKPFAPQLRNPSGEWPRNWIFVELGGHWYDRDMAWKLNEAGELFDMRNAPFEEPLISTSVQNEEAIAARKRLQAVLDQLNPAAGIMAPGDASGKGAKGVKRDKRRAEEGNTNADDQ